MCLLRVLPDHMLCNYVSDLQVSEPELQPGKRIPLTDIGAGCYPTTIFFNHSCAPNTVRINQGKRVCHLSHMIIRPFESKIFFELQF